MPVAVSGRVSVEALRPTSRVGCSGWQYKHWRGAFYPTGLRQSEWFSYYTSRFDTVEINNSFYRLPERETFAAWRRRAPHGFLYAVKASRFITHMKKLKEPAEPLGLFFARASGLGARLGPILYQLPPQFRVDLGRLRTFLAALPSRRRHVIEFRDPSWYTDEVFEQLTRHRVALCLHDMRGSATGRLSVGPFVYARFHGPAKYHGRYADDTLAEWAGWMNDRRRGGTTVYAYFNNDVGGQAPRDAARLRAMLG